MVVDLLNDRAGLDYVPLMVHVADYASEFRKVSETESHTITLTEFSEPFGTLLDTSAKGQVRCMTLGHSGNVEVTRNDALAIYYELLKADETSRLSDDPPDPEKDSTRMMAFEARPWGLGAASLTLSIK